jgi:hypothetical protein
MKKITAEELYEMIYENPSVFEHWDTPLEISEYVSCRKSPITHLSKYLTFSGKNDNGWCGTFFDCPSLKIATDTFHRYTLFVNSGIQKIENLIITKTDWLNWAANFESCKNLKIATGNYPGFVTFCESGVQSIQNLHIQNPSKGGSYASFLKCPALHTLESWDLSQKIDIEKEKLSKEKERRALLKFRKESQPKELPFL